MSVLLANFGAKILRCVFLFVCLSASGLLYASTRAPALEPFPSKILEDYFVCSTRHNANNESVDRYNAVASWFDSFRDSDIYHSVDNLYELIHFETLTHLVVLVKYSKDTALSAQCSRVTTSTLESIYKQADLAYEWILATEFTDKTHAEIQEIKAKADKLGDDIENAFKQYKEVPKK
ncbi:MAG: hypothetical protein VSS75_006195 [Candidatus Parabeggiatoa sp.]|nr:hypothetical protein [Candidatus Parabeggiatoa sp.]